MQIKNQIPNMVTLGNLLCGVVAIVVVLRGEALENKPWIIAGLMGGGLLFDFADGLVARLLKATSEIGKELDSLADLITFGVLPGLLVFDLLAFPTQEETFATLMDRPEAFVAALIPLFSAYRLAKFNVDDRPREKFYGLPTPANALFFLSLYLIARLDSTAFVAWCTQTEVLVAETILFSVLLVSNFPLISFKFSTFSLSPNLTRYLFLGISLILGIIGGYEAVPIIVAVYFLISFIDHRFLKHS